VHFWVYLNASVSGSLRWKLVFFWDKNLQFPSVFVRFWPKVGWKVTFWSLRIDYKWKKKINPFSQLWGNESPPFWGVFIREHW
jgi:hypothetical protein